MAGYLSADRKPFAGLNYHIPGTPITIDVAAAGTPAKIGDATFSALESPNADERAAFTVDAANGQITCTYAGVYKVTFQSGGSGNAAAHVMDFELYVDDTAQAIGTVYDEDGAVSVFDRSVGFVGVVEVAAGEKIGVRVDSDGNGDDWVLKSFNLLVETIATRQ